MNKLLLVLGIAVSMPLCAMEAEAAKEEEEDPLLQTVFVLKEGERLLGDEGSKLEDAEKAAGASLAKRDKYMQEEEELTRQLATRQELVRQIFECLVALENQLLNSAATEKRTAQEVEKLENLWNQLKADYEKAEDSKMKDPVLQTFREKNEEHGAQKSNIDKLKKRIDEIKNCLKDQQQKGSTDERELERISSVINQLEKQAYQLGKKHEGAVGNATMKFLARRVGDEEEAPPQEEKKGWGILGYCVTM